VKQTAWTFLLFLLCAVVCASAIPPTDLAETAFNEVDAPVNQAAPVVPCVKFIRPAGVSIDLPRAQCPKGRELQPEPLKSAYLTAGTVHDTHSLQDLLCTLLI
jgi:hypothetical protein